MDLDYCLTCQCHFEVGPFNPYCSVQCRPDIGHRRRPHQRSSYITQWAATIPHAFDDPSSSPPSPPPAHRSRSRPKLLTSLSKPPASTTSSSFQHADVLSSSPSSSSASSDFSLATPTSPKTIWSQSSDHSYYPNHSSSSKPMDISNAKRLPSPTTAYESSYLPQPRYIPSRGRL